MLLDDMCGNVEVLTTPLFLFSVGLRSIRSLIGEKMQILVKETSQSLGLMEAANRETEPPGPVCTF